MKNRKENVDKLIIKLEVLENKIQKLEALTDEVLNDVQSEYNHQIKELNQKKEAAKQQLLAIQEADENAK